MVFVEVPEPIFPSTPIVPPETTKLWIASTQTVGAVGKKVIDVGVGFTLTVRVALETHKLPVDWEAVKV